MNVTKAQVLGANDKRADRWALGNQTLYQLCARHPKHSNDAEIVAKIWLIGKAYSAALDRGRGKGPHRDLSNDLFYTTAVPQELRELDIDPPLRALSKLGPAAWDHPKVPLLLHARLTAAFKRMSGKNHRSLASKYLHFHCPSVFYLFDSRAVAAARTMVPLRTVQPVFTGGDSEYAEFATRVVALTRHIANSFGVQLTPRELDRLLLSAYAAAH